VIDAHCHVASSDTTRYPLAPTGVGTDWWKASADLGSLLARMDEAGVERAVVVQAVGAYGYDCSYAIDAAASEPDRLALVGVVDFEIDEPPLIGAAVRVFGVGGGLTSPTPAWLTDGRAARVWERCAASGIGVVATILEPHLPSLVPLIRYVCPFCRVAPQAALELGVVSKTSSLSSRQPLKVAPTRATTQRSSPTGRERSTCASITASLSW